MFIGVYSSTEVESYVATGPDIGYVMMELSRLVANDAKEDFCEDRVTVYRGDLVKFVKQYIIMEPFTGK